MYKSRFKRWGLWKYNKIADVAEILRHKKEGTMAQLPEELAIRSKGLDIQRAEKYVKRRMRTQAARLQQQQQHRHKDQDTEQLTLISNASSSPEPMSQALISPSHLAKSPMLDGLPTPIIRPAYLRSPSPFFEEEQIYRVIQDYYDGSFLQGAWPMYVPPGVTTPSRRQLSDFYSRFKIAMNLLIEAQSASSSTSQNKALKAPPLSPGGGSAPVAPRNPAEGIKMMRICFAQLPEVLAGEDPQLFNYMLDIVLKLREAGLGFIEAQLLRHLYGLAMAQTHSGSGPRRAQSTGLIWKMLGRSSNSNGVISNGAPPPAANVGPNGATTTTTAIDRDHASRCMQVMLSQFEKHLGPWHAQTIELMEFWILKRGDTLDAQVRGLRQLYAGLEAALGRETFDSRHIEMLSNLANLLRRNGRTAEAAAVLDVVLGDPARVLVLRRVPAMAFNVYWLMGKVISLEGRHAEAEGHFRAAIGIAGNIEDTGGAEYLSGLVALEQCLRDQERVEEADLLLLERQALVKQTLEEVGEKEDAV
jgi:hypothetical protein